jgi:threonine dehydratase
VITLADVRAARERIAGSIVTTPCRFSVALSKRVGAQLWLKLENAHLTGSFKERGACHRLSVLTADERRRGVICASAGNHAQSVAYHAERLGIDATIVMPTSTPLIKVQSTRAFGARVVLHGASYDDAYDEALRLQAAEGRILIHAFEDDAIISGQGTCGLEILEQVPDVEAIVVPIGGGGIAAGIGVAVKTLAPEVKVYGVEVAAVPSMTVAMQEGRPSQVAAARTIAEGIAVRRVGERTLAMVRAYVDEVVLVEDEEIAEAILVLLEREKTVAEGAGAAAVSAVLEQRLPLAGKRVVSVVSGGNIDVNLVSRIIERGLVKSGRLIKLAVNVPDVSGSLARLARIVADQGANVVEIHHERAFAHAHVGEVVIDLELETRGFEHALEVRQALADAGYRVEIPPP